MGKQGSRGQNLAAKKRRRAARAGKSASTPSPTLLQARYTVPIWQYPSAARILTEQMPELTHTEALTLMLAEPVNWQNTDGRISSIIPAEVIASTGESVETFIASFEVLHELGRLAWDNIRRVHIQTCPDDDPVVP